MTIKWKKNGEGTAGPHTWRVTEGRTAFQAVRVMADGDTGHLGDWADRDAAREACETDRVKLEAI